MLGISNKSFYCYVYFNAKLFFFPISLVSIFCWNKILLIALKGIKHTASGDVYFLFWMVSDNFYSSKPANEYWPSENNRLSYIYVVYYFKA